MRLQPDQNRCCTAIYLCDLNCGIDHGYYKREGLGTNLRWDPDPDYCGEDEQSYKEFELALALLRKNYVEYTDGLESACFADKPSFSYPKTIYDRGEEVDYFSTVFCFTSTGEESSEQDEIERFLEEFGFEGSVGRSSQKYRGDSIVRLWSMSVEDFCKRCDEVMERIPSGYYGEVTIKDTAKAAA